MAGRELPPVDDDVNLDRFAKLEKTLNQILMEIQKLSRDDHHDQVQDVDEFEDSLYENKQNNLNINKIR